MKCLIIEDDLMMRRSLEILCSRIPGLMMLSSVDNGKDALGIINHQKVDIILLDMNLPFISGLELIDEIDESINIICTSASEFPEKIPLKHNILAKFIKPVRHDELKQIINKLMVI